MSTPLVIVSMGASGSLTPIAQDAAGYSGTLATKLVGGPSSGSADFPMKVHFGASPTAANIIRLFKKIGGTLFFQYAVRVQTRASNADDPTWNTPQSLGTLRLSASSEEIWVSQEKNDANLSISYDQFNLG